MADTIIEMPFIANYQAVYSALNTIVKRIVNESYFKLWQKAEAENISLRAELAAMRSPIPLRHELAAMRSPNMNLHDELAALRVPVCTTPLHFHPKPTLLPLYGPDSPV